MYTREEKHQNRDRLCYSCDNLVEDKNKLITYSVSYRGYGSIFDGCRFSVQLCRNCDKPKYKLWFNEVPEMDDYCEVYKNEEKIRDFVNSFIIENQEYVWNGMDGYHMDRGDWIDMENGVLPEEKYEEYGMYSPSQVNAYNERFSTCEHPVQAVFSDNSIGCYCPYGASGYEGQTASPNISIECHGCTHYKKRETPMKEMDYGTYQKYEKYIQAKLHIQLYRDLFE